MTPYLRNFSILATVSVLANACVIKLVEDDASWEDDTSWEDNDGYDDTSSGSSVGGFGGEAGAGGHGGSTDPGNGGSGEDPYCNDGESDQTAALCDELGVATETCDGFAAPGYAACHRGFEIYEAAHAAELASCLGLIPATDACEIAPIDACVGSMYEQACADDDIDLVCAHQANLRILKSVSERCGIPMDRFHNNIHEYGNTSSASVPIVMQEALEIGRIKPGSTLLLLAAGAGLSYGGAVVRW